MITENDMIDEIIKVCNGDKKMEKAMLETFRISNSGLPEEDRMIALNKVVSDSLKGVDLEKFIKDEESK